MSMYSFSKLSYKFRIHLLLFVTSLMLIIISVLNKTPTRLVAENSMAAAVHFLYLVDTEEYTKSWEVSADILKKMLTKKAWNEQIAKIRSFYGPILERRHKDIVYTDSADSVPDGRYVILTFISKFESRDYAIETITLMLGADNLWKVAGYFVR